MTWTSFIITLVLAYLVYFGLNVLFDLLMGRKQATSNPENEELFFEERVSPEPITYVEQAETSPAVQPEEAGGSTIQSITSGLIQATGAVGLKQLFSRAKDDLIEYTKAIPY